MRSIVSRHMNLQYANSVQLLVTLQQAILQPCNIWAPADAAIVPLGKLQSLQHSLPRCACRVMRSFPTETVFQELSFFIPGASTRWHDIWWHGISVFMQADSVYSIVLHDAFPQSGCCFGWAAQVIRCFAQHVWSSQ